MMVVMVAYAISENDESEARTAEFDGPNMIHEGRGGSNKDKDALWKFLEVEMLKENFLKLRIFLEFIQILQYEKLLRIKI